MFTYKILLGTAKLLVFEYFWAGQNTMLFVWYIYSLHTMSFLFPTNLVGGRQDIRDKFRKLHLKGTFKYP